MPLAMTAPHQMTCAMAVANTGTGSKFAGLLLWSLYLMETRTWTAILSPPTSSHILYAKTHSRASFSTLTSVPLLPHQPLPNGSDWLWLLLQHYTCHWPQQALPCMSGSVLCLSPWLLKVSHPNLGANHNTVHLAWEIIQDYCPINHCGALLCPPLRIGWQHPHEGIIHYDVDTANHLESTQTSSPSLGELTLDYIKLANPELFECSGKLSEPFSITLNPDVKPIQAPPHRYAAP